MTVYEIITEKSNGEQISTYVTCNSIEQSDNVTVLVDGSIMIDFEYLIVGIEEVEFEMER